MKPNSAILDKWLDDTRVDLVKNYIDMGLRASGNWAAELETKIESKNGKLKGFIIGESYTQQLENGRRPNVFNSPKDLKAFAGWAGSTFIKKWVEDKGLDLNPFAVAYKIGKEGWKVPNRYNKGGLVTDVITKKRIQELSDSLGLAMVDGFKSDIIKEFK